MRCMKDRWNIRSTWWMPGIAIALSEISVFGVRALFHIHGGFWSFVALWLFFFPLWWRLVPALTPAIADLAGLDTRRWESRPR